MICLQLVGSHLGGRLVDGNLSNQLYEVHLSISGWMMWFKVAEI